MSDLAKALAKRAAERGVAERQVEYADEVRRIVDTTFQLIERTGNVNPSLRDVLAETGIATQAFYRYFRSKDELLLVLLDDGRRQLVGYLSHRMSRFEAIEEKIGAWVRGVLAQASDRQAASRTRPFVANEDRLNQLFPDEQQQSVELLTSLLAEALVADRGPKASDEDRARDLQSAQSIYDVTFAALRRHLTRGTAPSSAEVDRLVEFCLGGVSDSSRTEIRIENGEHTWDLIGHSAMSVRRCCSRTTTCGSGRFVSLPEKKEPSIDTPWTIFWFRYQVTG